MAITRTQIAKQLLANGGRIALKGGADASDRDVDVSPTGDVSVGPSETGGNGSGRDPMKQFDFKPPTPMYDEFDKPSTRNFNFMKDARKKANPLGFLTEIKGPIGALSRFLTPNPFGFSPTAPQSSSEGGNGPVPYWAQLGFSSEAEYLASLAAQGKSTTEQEPEVEEPFQLSRRFRAEGGIMNADVVGGEFDFESARQMYGLGKLVKKVTRSVKKIAKSPIGKAAIIGAIGFGIPGTSIGGLFGRASFGGAATGLFGKQGIAATLAGLKGTAATKAIGVDKFGNTIYSRAAPSLFSSIPGGGVTAAIAGTSLLAGLLTPEQEEEAQELARGEGIDIEQARRSILSAGTQDDFRARRFRAEGGSMKEPVAKKTMPLLDMGGKEMDLRAEGGFVPIGRMEKADDVPARLSKNEFVFTADAVRNAGDGDVDKGAEVMYNMMKNLESGGDVSEESQGLEGARKMFQTSQRLEEVL
jgi:hypothetical protein